MKRKPNNRGIVFLIIGSLLLLIAGGWYIYNTVEDESAGAQASALLDKLSERRSELQSEQQYEQQLEQQYEQSDKNDPSVIVVDGDAFCGTVIIDRLGIELPVFDEWNYTRLKEAPCRYSGAVNTNDIIIAAHNYKSHFGNITRLQTDDEIIFTDAYGSKHRYAVREITTLDGTAVTDMKSGEWDFTLFTCSMDGEQRVTVRCDRIPESHG